MVCHQSYKQNTFTEETQWRESRLQRSKWFVMQRVLILRLWGLTRFLTFRPQLSILQNLPPSIFWVNLHWAFTDFHRCYLVFDLLTGGDMRYQLSNIGRTFTEKEARFYLASILLIVNHVRRLSIFAHFKPYLLYFHGYRSFTLPNFCSLLYEHHLQLHEHDIIHRDIKPENIMLDSQGFCVLTDFGISHALNSSKQ